MPKEINNLKEVGLIFDLDGTLLDYNDRYYVTYADVLKQYGIKCLDKNKLFDIRKKTRCNSREILNQYLIPNDLKDRESVIENCLKKRNFMIEDWKYLQSSECFEGVHELLSNLKEEYTLIMVTARNNKKNLIKNLQNTNLLTFFNKVICGKNRLALLKNFIKKSSFKECFVIGDAVENIQFGKSIGLKTIAVLSGIDSEENLKKEKPNFIIEKVTDLPKLKLRK